MDRLRYSKPPWSGGRSWTPVEADGPRIKPESLVRKLSETRIARWLGLAGVDGDLIRAYRTIVISNRVKHVLAQGGMMDKGCAHFRLM